jgi:HEAT repeat protein
MEAPIERALAAAATPEQISFFLSVAGNAGCQKCNPLVENHLKSQHPEVRMAATHALRFLASPESVSQLCDAVLRDPLTAVRDLAAWSLQWRRNEPETRAECLVAAAATDSNIQVRKQAVFALAKLSEDDLEARDGLLHLTLPEYPEPVRRLSRSGLESATSADPRLPANRLTSLR